MCSNFIIILQFQQRLAWQARGQVSNGITNICQKHMGTSRLNFCTEIVSAVGIHVRYGFQQTCTCMIEDHTQLDRMLENMNFG